MRTNRTVQQHRANGNGMLIYRPQQSLQMGSEIKILAIESSCDETAAAVV